uniref:Selenoprotein F n=1 Tax=Sphenodon punctatus TaxID=8508 RepID=A0A8D0GBY4_SPHPU
MRELRVLLSRIRREPGSRGSLLAVSRRHCRFQSSSKMAATKGVMGVGRCWLGLLAALQAISAYGAELSSDACRELGFSSNLLCSSCDLLGEFSLSQLDPFCRKCCQEEAQSEAKKLYAGAVLEVCG